MTNTPFLILLVVFFYSCNLTNKPEPGECSLVYGKSEDTISNHLTICHYFDSYIEICVYIPDALDSISINEMFNVYRITLNATKKRNVSYLVDIYPKGGTKQYYDNLIDISKAVLSGRTYKFINESNQSFSIQEL